MGMTIHLYYKNSDKLVKLTNRLQISEYYVSNKPQEIKVFLKGCEYSLTDEEVELLSNCKSDLYDHNGNLLYKSEEYSLSGNSLVL